MHTLGCISITLTSDSDIWIMAATGLTTKRLAKSLIYGRLAHLYKMYYLRE